MILIEASSLPSHQMSMKLGHNVYGGATLYPRQNGPTVSPGCCATWRKPVFFMVFEHFFENTPSSLDWYQEKLATMYMAILCYVPRSMTPLRPLSAAPPGGNLYFSWFWAIFWKYSIVSRPMLMKIGYDVDGDATPRRMTPCAPWLVHFHSQAVNHRRVSACHY